MLEREVEIAKKCLAEGNKQKALLCLKKKRYQEQMLEKTDGQLRNIEEMVLSITWPFSLLIGGGDLPSVGFPLVSSDQLH